MLKKFFIKTIRFYQIAISPRLSKHCRFYPSCSEYCVQAIEKRGVVWGIIIGMWRILRCNPLSRGGVDMP